MNALDKAFIKAFAKDRTLAASAQPEGGQATELRTLRQPPAEGVDSVSLVLHDLYQQGKRLRIDQPDSEVTVQDAHMILPLVEQVQSYDPAEMSAMTQPTILYEDRLAPLDDPSTGEQPQEAGSDVCNSMDAVRDTEVPASEPEAVAESQDQEATPDGDADLYRCQPRSYVASMPAATADLMTLEFSNEGLSLLPAGTADTTVAVLPPDLDLDAVTEAVREQEAREQRLRDMAVAVATQSILEPQAFTTDWGASREAAEVEPPVNAADLETASADTISEEPEVTDTSSVEPASPPFAPAWEVDAFRWPPICQELDEQTGGRLTQSGEELYVATRDGLKVLAVTSTCRQEGRSTLALALAHTAAQAGSRVALVDGDIANPQLARRLGLEAPCDWHDVVRRGEPLTEAAVTSLGDRVTLFPRTTAGDPLTSPLDQWLVNTLQALREYFDLVVVDMAPIGKLEITSQQANSNCPIDMAVVLRNVLETSEDRCLNTVTTLRAFGVQAVGIIENFDGEAGESA